MRDVLNDSSIFFLPSAAILVKREELDPQNCRPSPPSPYQFFTPHHIRGSALSSWRSLSADRSLVLHGFGRISHCWRSPCPFFCTSALSADSSASLLIRRWKCFKASSQASSGWSCLDTSPAALLPQLSRRSWDPEAFEAPIELSSDSGCFEPLLSEGLPLPALRMDQRSCVVRSASGKVTMSKTPVVIHTRSSQKWGLQLFSPARRFLEAAAALWSKQSVAQLWPLGSQSSFPGTGKLNFCPFIVLPSQQGWSYFCDRSYA